MKIQYDIKKMLKSNQIKVIEEALYWIGDYVPDDAISLILPFTIHPIESIRETASYNLGEINNSEAINILFNIIKNEESSSVREYAIMALREYQNNIIYEFLLNHLATPLLDNGIRSEAYYQLRHYPTDESRKLLSNAFFDSNLGIHCKTIIIDSLYKLNQKDLLNSWMKIKKTTDNEYFFILSSKAIIELTRVTNLNFNTVNFNKLNDVEIVLTLFKISVKFNTDVLDYLLDLLKLKLFKDKYAYGILSINTLIALIILEKGDKEATKRLKIQINQEWKSFEI